MRTKSLAILHSFSSIERGQRECFYECRLPLLDRGHMLDTDCEFSFFSLSLDLIAMDEHKLNARIQCVVHIYTIAVD